MNWTVKNLKRMTLKHDHLVAQNHRCYFCHHEISTSTSWLKTELRKRAPIHSVATLKSAATARLATLEHLQLSSRGGKDIPEHTVVACHFCNSLRSNGDLATAHQFIRALLLARLHPHQLFLQSGLWFKLTQISPAFTAWIEQQQQGNDPCSKSLKPSAPAPQSPPPLSADRDQAKPTAP